MRRDIGLWGLSRQPKQAKTFYGTIAAATLVGAVANILKISPMKALVWSAVLNAIVAVQIMVLLMQMATNRSIMGKSAISRRPRVGGWIATLIMVAASLGFIISLVFR
ncbi:MAG: divalent metal cation transporter [Steroidobacteraceae bacterium]